MLTREGSTGCNRNLHHLGRCGKDSVEGPGLLRIERHERVEVPVACVEHVEHRDPEPIADLVDLFENLDEPCTGHNGVVEVVVRSSLGDSPKGGLPALPQERPLGVIFRHPNR